MRPTAATMPCTLCSRTGCAGQQQGVSRPFAARVIPALAPRTLTSSRGDLAVVEAQNALRRQRVEARNAAYNKHYKELVKSSSRAVLRGYQAMLTNISNVTAEADLQPVDSKMHVAFSNIDKAAAKGVMHKNTASRRKKKLTTVRKQVLAAAGLYPAPQPSA